ncbi:superoxide dismutase [Candidatus Berkelbacteria bacterium]|nr:superoxide dismutase [Candidatus Berkelbacteria bacterium]
MPHQVKELLKGKEDALKGISKKTIEIHRDKLYAGYVKKRNEVEEKLAGADKEGSNQIYSEWRGLKEGETFAANGMVLHEYYFGVLGGDGDQKKAPTVLKKIEQDFGSFEEWKANLVACGMSGRGWGVLAYDPSDGKLHNYIGDAQNQGAVWGATPLVALDVYEHSYFADYGSDRKAYIEAFFENIDWARVEKMYDRVGKTYAAAI